ncbi:hypothetical protein METESE_36570 [Mesoterricola sediminis]|uniref:Peptidase M48 domain-containing protein n=1 Tax=Mesoterricola sediminis TaxID=2927980 RepID=A0AA48GVR2_9BACT|nr:hypothetical protein METESE_36570 [Mesoterricola sediminis]
MRKSGLLLALPLLAGAGAAAQDPPAKPHAPALGSEEGGLRALCDREEAKLLQSPLLVRDPALTAYVQAVCCRLAGPLCPEVRVHILRTPYFNASMAPNGMMQVWTGLLLRCADEAQLATILGHEIAHYHLRHGLDQLRDAKSRSAFATLALMVPIAGPLASLGAVAGGFAYSRDHERAADAEGLERLAEAGYPAGEAPRVWSNLLEELKAEGGGDAAKRSRLFATHPPETERQRALEAAAARMAGADRDPGRAAFRAAIAPFRMGWMEDELKRRRYGESVALLTRLCGEDPQDGLARYFLGEACRLRDGDGDAERARRAYGEALELPGAPPEVHRALGRLHRRAGRMPEMRAAYARYLALRPDAEDAEMIKTYLKETP